jgi:glycosyltransferase involved in cell wall biosynthesis
VRIGFDAKRIFHNFTGLGNYSRFVVDALSTTFPRDEYFLYTPKTSSHAEAKKYLDSSRFSLRQPQGRTPGAWWRTLSVANDIQNDQLNVFHGLSNELPWRKPAGVRTVLTVHDLIFLRFPEYYGVFDVEIYKWKLKHSCRTADCIVAVSHQTATDLHEFLGVDPSKIVVVHQGCHPSFYREFSPEAIEEVRSKYGLPKEFLLFVGTLEKRKNAGLIIKALARLKSRLPVVLAGKPTKYVAELEELVTKYSLQDRVKFVYNAAFADLPAFYQAASIFLYPSVFEGFGIPIVEAIASGVPVITSNGSCFSEAGGPDCIYVNPSNPEELADSITMVLDNSDLRSTMIDASRHYIEKFNPRVIAGELMKVYQRP